MSERYNVPASDVLGDNYKITNIVCSDYNPNIDSTITVTVSVNDVYGDAVSGESVTVTASEGNFTQLNGSDITGASTVTGTTNSSGQFTLTYSCTVWGLVTFSANNTSIQTRVNGWRSVNISVSYAGFYVNEAEKLCRLTYYRTGYNFSDTAFKTLHSGVIPSKYRALSIGQTNDPVMVFMVNGSGDIQSKSNTTGSRTINASVNWSY